MITYLIIRILQTAAELYIGVIIIYVLMSWIPNKEYGWIGDIYRALGRLCDPYLQLFQRIIPPIGGMLDISPIIAIIVLQLLTSVLVRLLYGLF